MTVSLPPRAWSPDVRARLEQLLDAPGVPRPVAVLDWDDTMLEGDLSLATLRWMDARHGTDWHDTYWRLLAEEGRDVAYPQITRWFAGRTPEALDALSRTIVDEVHDRGLPHLRPEMADLLLALQQQGWDVWVVTASPAAVVSAWASRLGIQPDRVLGMRLELGPDGRFTERIDGIATYCEGKARAVRAFIGDRIQLCAGDSRSDVDMMELADVALLVDGHDADLRAEARSRGWLVQSGWPHTPPEPWVRTDPEASST